MFGVIGLGVVGGAVQKGLNCPGYDKYKDSDSFEKVAEASTIFLCLPTLYSQVDGEYDKTAIHDVCTRLNDMKYSGLIVLKSTVEPGTTESLNRLYENLKIVHNPEFLTARTALDDFRNQQHIVVGTDGHDITELLEYFRNTYTDNITVCKSKESESMKIMCNSFYAVKVQLFNEFYLTCKDMDISFDVVRSAMLKNNWINPMHTDVPGPDGRMSYGGMCFPKDTNALLRHMMRHQTPHAVLKGAVDEQMEMRGFDE